MPCALSSLIFVLKPNNLYWDFSRITTLEKLVFVEIKEVKFFCIDLDMTPKPKSPILSVPLRSLNPSGARKITSPPISCIVSPSKQPMSLV